MSISTWELLGEDRPQGNFIEVVLSTVIFLLAVVIDKVWRWTHE